MEEIKFDYDGIEIRYVEDKNEWEFELRGRLRTAPSLAKAKEYISKEPAQKRKPFEKFEALLLNHWQGRKIVTVTSYAGKGWDNRDQWWTSSVRKDKWNSKTERNKIDGNHLIVLSDVTTKTLAQIDALAAEIKKLEANKAKLAESLERIKPTKEMLQD